MKLHYITDVNLPGHFPDGGWWFVIKNVYDVVTGRMHRTRQEAEEEMELLTLIN